MISTLFQQLKARRWLRTTLWSILFWTRLVNSEAAETQAESDSYVVELKEFHEFNVPHFPQVKGRSYVLQAREKSSGRSIDIVFKVEGYGTPEEIKSLRIVGAHLAIITRLKAAIFDLHTGQEKMSVSCINPTPSPDGRWIAYEVFHPRFTPPEAAMSIAVVIDTTSLETRPVFPEPEGITEGPDGQPLVWEPDFLKRHQIEKFYWAPDNRRLLFFCKHGAETAGPQREVTDYYVLVDLRRGVTKAQFIHKEIPRDVYMKPEMKEDGKMGFSAETVRWIDENTVEVTPLKHQWWAKEVIILKLS